MKETTTIKYVLTCLFFSIWFWHSPAQIPVEISAGHAGYYYQHSFATRFNPGKSLGFFHTSSVLIPYDKNRGNEIMSQSYLSYTMSKRWTAGVGTIFTPVNRVRPSVFFQYFHKGKTTSVLIYPRMDTWSVPNFELMGFIEYQGAVNRPVNLYARFQYMTTWNRNGHSRSYQYTRAGIDTRGIQFGLAANFDQYGTLATNYSNFGLFVRKVF
ncbi:hypothetical protein BCY89_27260 [Sphingobacterium siyangense]|uniref:Uncharacterized protein n=1 Tax=Sphingobacterium siyangense TaxID=459529 RepID=A0A420G014_9SPHI|nr:hypothetical protein [Sphingobacterium siyangense]RKF38517.1 hypothetical protein BCY89_27260 [Sphingobacterium siyangense]